MSYMMSGARCFLALAVTLSACVESPTTPAIVVPSGSLELAGQVVRNIGATDEPVGGLTLYLYAPVPAGPRGAQWIDRGSGTSLYPQQGSWAITIAKQHSDIDGSFRFTGLDSGYTYCGLFPMRWKAVREERSYRYN